MNDPALVLFSGGQDSTTCLLWALREGNADVHAVSFYYGQRHAVELQQANRILNAIYERIGRRVGHHWLPVPALGALAGAALTNDSIPVEGRATADAGNAYAAKRGLPSTFVPGRNAIFFATAAALAAKLDAPNLVTGICAADESGYPDCRPEFALAAQRMLRTALDWPQLTLHTPLLHRTKATTWQLAHDVAGDWGVELVLNESHTCYQGDRTRLHDWGYGCGECPACTTRRHGWMEYTAGVAA